MSAAQPIRDRLSMLQPRRARVAAFLLSVLGATTQDRYLRALQAFLLWTRAEQIDFDTLPFEEQDIVLADYGLHLRTETGMIQDYRDTMASVQKQFPGRTFKTAWKVVSAWAKQKPAQQVPPLSQELASALSVLLAAAGRPGIDIVIALAFAGMLRISEALRLRWGDLLFSERGLVLRLLQTKLGETQYVVVDNVHTQKFVLGLRPPGASGADFLCPTGYSTFRFWFQSGLRVCGCAHLGFKSHSLRRGGATCRLMHGYTMARIMTEGRWNSEASCRLYLRAAEATILQIRRDLSPEKQALVRTLASLWGQVVMQTCSDESRMAGTER